MVTEEQKEFRKYGITARKYEGDDLYSWAVFRRGRPVITGLSQSEMHYYKRKLLGDIKKEGIQNG